MNMKTYLGEASSTIALMVFSVSPAAPAESIDTVSIAAARIVRILFISGPPLYGSSEARIMNPYYGERRKILFLC